MGEAEFKMRTEERRRIRVGGKTKETLLRRLGDAQVGFNEYARTLFDHPLFAPEHPEENVELVALNAAALGIAGPASYADVLARSATLGLRTCPLHLGAFLRLEFPDQPEGPYLTLASPPLDRDETHPTGFYIRNLNGTLWLRGYRVTGAPEWPAENEFVFTTK